MGYGHYGPCIEYDDVKNQINWSRVTFGPNKRTKGIVDHIKKELEEIEADPTDLYEWVDIIILAIDGAWRSGHNTDEIILAYKEKMQKNYSRKWPDWTTKSDDEAIEHDRSYD